MTTPSRDIEQQGPSGLPELYKYGFAVAKRAVQEDNAKQWTTAWGLYEDAAHTVLQLLQHESDPKKIALLHLKWDEYSHRAEELSRLVRVSRVDELQTDASIDVGIEQVTCDTDHRFEADAGQIPLEIEKAGSQENDNITNRERSDSSVSQIASSHGHLAPFEIEVLKRSSIINGRLYLPWIAMDDKERFSFDVPFKDPQGPLSLSLMQRAAFAEWKRVSEIFSEHRMVLSMYAGAIVQDLVTDCSFVASLCVSSEYERKFEKQLITSRIYPQNKSGQPMYNPSGKYMVVVDDYLPVGKDGRLLCTFSLNREIWPSIVEKAYLKLQGGYGFPGSNSGIDLHALTGWIPEHIFIKDGSLPPMSIFRRLQDGYQAGHALITVATSSLRENNIGQFGLIAGHAYAVLDVRIVQVGDTQYNLLQIKNPWRSMQRESKILTQDPHLRQKTAQALAASGLEVDEKADGIFWIDFQSICDWFDTIHINWNPHMWEHRFTLHASWPVTGPRKDVFNFGSNPQYSLQVDVSNENSTAVWILLTKHVTVTVGTIMEENGDYITLHLYGDSGGERVFYSGEPMLRGVYVNSPHVLVRFKSSKGSG
ncbi:hypothetical protein SpCBS45565_g05884 [Spizellomyces sp. 'palustris']|nr:hypothetical protein SpCBS45565_g05884 [Spizellomyces sp. 'palustris']